MKKILINWFNTGNMPVLSSFALFVFRIVTGIFMLTHGYGKLRMLFGSDPIQFADPIGIGVNISLALVVFAEFFCSIFLILGLATRFASIPLLITMLVAAFVFHAADPFFQKELPLVYATIYLVIAIVGPGKISVDNWIYKNWNK